MFYRVVTILSLLLWGASAVAGQACDIDNHIPEGTPRAMPNSDGLHDQVLCNAGYVVGYSFHFKSPVWVAYRLTEDSVTPDSGRTDDFRVDTRIPEEHRATLPDYRRSGFDRGHMAPRASMDATVQLGSDSFLLSNMTPQLSGLNRSGWAGLERHIRNIAIDRDEIFVFSGAVFEGVNRTIGKGKVGVPSHFFKIIYDPELEQVFSVLIPHEAFSFADIDDFVASVNDIESWSGIDFLHRLPNARENVIEREDWPVWTVD